MNVHEYCFKMKVYVLRSSVEFLHPKSTCLLYENFTEIQNQSQG